MPKNNDEIFDSPRDDPEHLFWLEQGRRTLTDSVTLTTARAAAATSLMTASALCRQFI